MLAARLSSALSEGLITLPDTGRIAVIGPAEEADLSLLPKDRTEIIARLFPAHARFSREGFATTTETGGPYAMTIVCLPRARAEAERNIARARATTDGPIVVDGAKTDGVESILRAVRKRTSVEPVLSKAHGKLFVFEGGQFDDWNHSSGNVGRFLTAPGVFSSDGIDPGSQALAAILPPKLSGHVVDLGAGWGFLADAILSRDGVVRLDLVEADHDALEAARSNIADARAHFHWADARKWRPGQPVDHVVSNPPFHQGRRAEPELGRDFIRAAGSMLAPSGSLWLVANRHLPYETVLNDTFRDVAELDGPAAFKLIRARKPKRPPGRG